MYSIPQFLIKCEYELSYDTNEPEVVNELIGELNILLGS